MPSSTQEKSARTVLRAGLDQPSDQALVERILDGDRWAQEALFRRYVEPLGSVVVRLLQSRSDAEDVVHDTFVTAFSQLHKLREPAAVKGWLMQIAVRKVHRRFRRQRLLSALGFEQRQDATYEVCVSAEAGPEVRAELALLDRRIQKLPTPERIAWVLRAVEGEPIKVIAQACDCSVSTAKRRIEAARVKLGLDQGGEDEEAS